MPNRRAGTTCPGCHGRQDFAVRATREVNSGRSAVGADAQRGQLTSVTGTIFQDTRKPRVDWFRTMYLSASHGLLCRAWA